jgi:hypothetical protein
MQVFLRPSIGGEVWNVLKRGISDLQAVGCRAIVLKWLGWSKIGQQSPTILWSSALAVLFANARPSAVNSHSEGFAGKQTNSNFTGAP